VPSQLRRPFSQDGLLDELKKALAERTLNAELDQHLASERAGADDTVPRNHHNGHSRKTVLTGTGKLELQVPRDRQVFTQTTNCPPSPLDRPFKKRPCCDSGEQTDAADRKLLWL
jgi:hypothetical protein